MHETYAYHYDWSNIKKDITLLEDVQKFALKVCTKSWDQDYNTLLAKSCLPSLQARHHQAKLYNLYKITNELIYFPYAPVFRRDQYYATRSSRDRLFVPIPSHSNQHSSSLFPSTINAWNLLPSDIQTLPSSTDFKRALKSLT